MTYSVIIGLYNHKQYLPKLIESLEGQMWRDFEVIFCDDGSTDGTKEWFKGKEFKFSHQYLWHKNKGMRLAKSINRGFKLAKGKHFIVIMGDSFLDTDYLMQMSYFLHQDYIVCGVRVQIDGTRAVDVDWRLKEGLIPQDNMVLLNDPFNAMTGNGLMFSRRIYEDIGGWDERIRDYGGDDNEFIARAYYKGYICWSVPSATLFHHWHQARDSKPKNSELIKKIIRQYAKK